jgi:hypothetical protein
MGAFRVEITQRPAVAGIQPTFAKPRAISGFAASVSTLGRQLPTILVALMTPAAIVGLAMGLWRLSADLDWAGAFPIASGFFSHWQVWIALSIGLKMLSSSLLAWESKSRKIPEEKQPMF